MKRCAYCGKEYPDEATECAIDHQPLAPLPPAPGSAAKVPRGQEKVVTIEIFASREIAELAATKLKAYGISCWLKSDDAGGMYPNLALAGGVRLQVRASDAEPAVALLKAQLSASEISELEIKVAAAPPPKENATAKFAPIQILLGLGFGIFVCLLCQQIEKFGTTTHNYYSRYGKINEQWVDQNSHAIKMMKDRNLDGKWDEWVYYRNGWLIRSELDNNFDGKPDEWWTYSDGTVATFAKDTDFNGIPDEFCTYTNGVLQQMEVRPNDSSFATQRWIYRNGVLSEIWHEGDSNGVFKEIVKYGPFFNTTNTQFGEFQFPSK